MMGPDPLVLTEISIPYRLSPKSAVTEDGLAGRYGRPEALQVHHPTCGHDFPLEMRELAYAMFEEQLRPTAAATLPKL
jgi:hypothetical protein